MNENAVSSPKKRGPKSIGNAPMTATERKRRSRELSRVAGEKNYLIRLNGLHQEWVDTLAQRQGVSNSAALHELIQAALDRFVGVMRRCGRLYEMGASEAQVEKFAQMHLMPPLPNINELEIPSEGN